MLLVKITLRNKEHNKEHGKLKALGSIPSWLTYFSHKLPVKL